MKHLYYYNKTKNYKYQIHNLDDNYNGIGKNDLFIREIKNKLIIKIRQKNKYPFQRIECIRLIENIWFSQYPNSKELLIFIKSKKTYKISIHKNSWMYRHNILYLLFNQYNKMN
jgi:hypothetical protein